MVLNSRSDEQKLEAEVQGNWTWTMTTQSSTNGATTTPQMNVAEYLGHVCRTISDDHYYFLFSSI